MNTEAAPLSSHEPIHLVVERNNLLKALSHCQGIVERRNTVPILSHVLLEAQGNTLKLTATDLEISFIETTEAQVKTQGKATVSAHLLFDIIRKLPDGTEIELKSNDDGSLLHLQSGRSSYNFACLPVAEFPFMTTEDLPYTLKIHAGELSRLIDRTRFSMSTEETRYYLNGIYIHGTQQGCLRAVATDGLRLAQAEVELSPDIKDMPGVIISRKTVQEIRKLIDEVAEEVTISLSDKQVRFVIGSSVFISRLIEGKFPQYENVIPSNNNNVLVVNAKAFAAVVDRISIMSTDKLRPVKLHVQDSTMTLSAHSSETGNAQEQVEISYDGSPMDFGFNSRYVLDVAQQISGDNLEFYIGDETQAIIAKDAEDKSALYVLMPMRV